MRWACLLLCVFVCVYMCMCECVYVCVCMSASLSLWMSECFERVSALLTKGENYPDVFRLEDLMGLLLMPIILAHQQMHTIFGVCKPKLCVISLINILKFHTEAHSFERICSDAVLCDAEVFPFQCPTHSVWAPSQPPKPLNFQLNDNSNAHFCRKQIVLWCLTVSPGDQIKR